MKLPMAVPTEFGGLNPATVNPLGSLGRMINLAPLVGTGRYWRRWTGPLISLLILAVVLYQLRGLDLPSLASLLPTTGIFWAAFFAYYLAGPISEWIIFRRLWALPLAGFLA